MKLNLKVTPNDAISRLKANDPTFFRCDLSGSAVLQMKAAELMPQLAAALGTNSNCRELHLVDCNVDDAACALFAKALQTNSGLAHLNLEGNRVNNEGAILLARALAENRGLMLLNLLSQKGSRFGDSTLHEFVNMFDSNVTLLKIVWCVPCPLYWPTSLSSPYPSTVPALLTSHSSPHTHTPPARTSLRPCLAPIHACACMAFFIRARPLAGPRLRPYLPYSPIIVRSAQAPRVTTKLSPHEDADSKQRD